MTAEEWLLKFPFECSEAGPDCAIRSALRGRMLELSRRRSAICENGMQFRDNDCSLADGRAHPLDRPRPHIADGEYAANARFQRLRTAGSTS
jgi:hypothetical protein